MPCIFAYDNGGNMDAYQDALADVGAHALFSRDLTLAAGCDGLLLPGGGDISPARYGQQPLGEPRLDIPREEAEFFLLEQFLSAGKPVLGICLGMQMLNVAMGGDLRQWIPDHGGRSDGSDSLHETMLASDSPLAEVYGPCGVVNSYHRQAVGKLGRELVVFQWADDGIIEGIRHRSLPVLAVQWHPERLTGKRRRVGAVDGGEVFRWLLHQLVPSGR